MCGILGAFDPSGINVDPSRFSAALERLRRRGPDDVGVWKDSHVNLGHRRLAIVDLTSAGHQPMQSRDRRYVIVFNGEIYNHQDLRALLAPLGGWSGTSDTETLLEAYRTWGVACLQRLNGMFAFAIWDSQDKTLFLARDRLGVKPLYYGGRGSSFGFASRPGALTQLLSYSALDIEPDALRAFLELGYVPGSLAFHRRMQKLLPGHYLLVSPRGRQLVRYWDFRSIAEDPRLLNRPEEELVEELDELVRRAVKIRLMSDVPLGAFLSGGVDSGLVVAAMRAAGVDHPRTFTIAFDDKEFDEGPMAAATAQHLQVRHTEELLDVNSLLELLPTYVEEFDEPFSDSSAFPTMAVARLARRHVSVVLSGDGADELFGGYHYYPLIERLAKIARWRPQLKRSLAGVLAALPNHRAKLLAGALRSEDTVSLFNYLRSIGKDYPTLLSRDLANAPSVSESWFQQYAAGFAVDLSPAVTGMRLDLGITLPELFLQKVDIATMAYSLEARCPMTDYKLVEWATRLPLQLKLRNGGTKYLLRKALGRYVPEQIVHRKKMGFGVPIARWLRGPLQGWANDLVNDTSLLAKLPLDPIAVRSLLAQQTSGQRESHPLLWSVLMLLSFVRNLESSATQVGDYRQVA
jgi:asparagine synthase (glutamine-hydrolysing)